MSKITDWFDSNKRKLNAELNRKKPEVIENVRKEFERAREKADGLFADEVEEALLDAVDKVPLFGMGRILLSSLIESIDFERYINVGDNLIKLEKEIVKRIQGARL